MARTKTVSASDANRQFSRLLREVAAGEVVHVVSRGRRVATIGPATRDDSQRLLARRSLLQRLRQGTPSGRRDWTRAELYDDAHC